MPLRWRTASRGPCPSYAVVADPREGALRHPPPARRDPQAPGRRQPPPVHLLALLLPLHRPSSGHLFGDRLRRLACRLDAQAHNLLGPPPAPASVTGVHPRMLDEARGPDPRRPQRHLMPSSSRTLAASSIWRRLCSLGHPRRFGGVRLERYPLPVGEVGRVPSASHVAERSRRLASFSDGLTSLFSAVRTSSYPAPMAIDRRVWHPAGRGHGSEEDI
jgi:hypothetical protein